MLIAANCLITISTVQCLALYRTMRYHGYYYYLKQTGRVDALILITTSRTFVIIFLILLPHGEMNLLKRKNEKE